MMTSSVCVDASLIVRTLVPGPFSRQAEALYATWQQGSVTLLAPALFAFEVTSTLRNMVYRKELTSARGDAAFATFMRIPIRLSHRVEVFALAWELARQFNRSRAYDTAYLAVAQLHNCDFWTADEKLYNGVSDKLPWVKWVGNAMPNHES